MEVVLEVHAVDLNQLLVETAVPILFSVVSSSCSSVTLCSYHTCHIQLQTDVRNRAGAELTFKNPTRKLKFQLDGLRTEVGFLPTEVAFRRFVAANRILYGDEEDHHVLQSVFREAFERLQAYEQTVAPQERVLPMPEHLLEEFPQFQQLCLFGHHQLGAQLNLGDNLHNSMKQWLTQQLSDVGIEGPDKYVSHMHCSHIFANASLLEEPAHLAPRNRVFLDATANQVLSDVGDHIMVAIAGFENAWEVYQHIRNEYLRPARSWKWVHEMRLFAALSDDSTDEDSDDNIRDISGPHADLRSMYGRGVFELQMIGVNVLPEGGFDPSSPAVLEGKLVLLRSGGVQGLGKLLRRLGYKPYSGQPRCTVDHSTDPFLFRALDDHTPRKLQKNRQTEQLTLRLVLSRHYKAGVKILGTDSEDLSELKQLIVSATTRQVIETHFRNQRDPTCDSAKHTISCSLSESVDAMFSFAFKCLHEVLGDNAPTQMNEVELWVHRGRFPKLNVSAATEARRKQETKKFTKVYSHQRFQDLVDYFYKPILMGNGAISKYKRAVQDVIDVLGRPVTQETIQRSRVALNKAKTALNRLIDRLPVYEPVRVGESLCTLLSLRLLVCMFNLLPTGCVIFPTSIVGHRQQILSSADKFWELTTSITGHPGNYLEMRKLLKLLTSPANVTVKMKVKMKVQAKANSKNGSDLDYEKLELPNETMMEFAWRSKRPRL